MTPIRIQRKREKGWKMPPNTIYVGRPSLWGNPFRVVFSKNLREYGVVGTLFGSENCYGLYTTKMEASARAVDLFRAWFVGDTSHLRGKNLACWCPLDRPCHADILLKLANEQ